MNYIQHALPTLLAGVVIVVIALRAMYQARREGEASKAECDRQMAELARWQAEREAAEVTRLARSQAELVVNLDLASDDVLPDLPAAFKQTELLVSALSRQEQSLGGAGFLLTAAKIEAGAVQLTLSPVERTGSAERVRRIADEWNATGGPLPPGVTAARADVLAV